MRQKFVFVTAIAVCLTLTLVPALATERTIDRYGDRTKAGRGTGPKGVTLDPSDMATFKTFAGSSRSPVTGKAAVNRSGLRKTPVPQTIGTGRFVGWPRKVIGLHGDSVSEL